MQPILIEAVRNALSGMTTGPAPLADAIAFYARGAGQLASIEGILEAHIKSGPNDEIRKMFNGTLALWDWEANAPWTAASEPNSRVRRDRIYELMRITAKLQNTFDEHVPPYEGAKAIVIEDAATVGTWYTFEFRSAHNFGSSRNRVGKLTAKNV